MTVPSQLTRSQFESACRDFISDHAGNLVMPSPLSSGINLRDWVWKEHPTYSRLGYMERSKVMPYKDSTTDSIEDETDELNEIEDSEQVPRSEHSDSLINLRQYVVYSSTFQVPAFYFTVFDANGSPLNLHQILTSTSILRRSSLGSTVSLTSHQSLISTPQEEDAAPVALLTQGDHPVLGVPCWYLHPCETSNAVVDILKEKEDGQWEDGEQGWTRWLEAWFVVLSTAVDLR